MHMTIINIGHSLHYEVERLLGMYYDSKKIRTVDSREELEENYLETQLIRTKPLWTLKAKICLDGKVYENESKIEPDETEHMRTCERRLGVLISKLLYEATGRKLKWGVVTGIRPAKLVRIAKEKGMTDSEVRDFFMNDMVVSEMKTELTMKTYEAEEKILKGLDPMGYSLYFSMPFCPSRCHYCSFVSHSINTPKAKELAPKYVTLLCEELKYIGQQAKRLGLHLQNIYFGGGTPTTMTAPQLRAVTQTIAKYFPVKEAKEYTVEAGRPDTIDREKLEVLKQAGVTRISINPQTMCDKVLKAVGREHTAQDVVDCFHLARKVGFNDINMDLIAGLPEDTLETFKESVDSVIALDPENVTVHTLTIKRSSTFGQIKDNIIDRINEVDDMVEYAQQKLLQEEYIPYYLYKQKNTIGNLENVGFCKKGYEGIYNVYIMEECQTILAAGAGAVTKLKQPNGSYIERVFNFKYPFEYISRFEEMVSRKKKVEDFYDKYTKINNETVRNS